MKKNNIKLWKKAYTEMLTVCEKYTGFSSQFGFFDIDEMKTKAKNHLQVIEWNDKYGIELSHDHKPYSTNFIRINDYLSFQLFKDSEKCKEEHRGRSISWSDDGRQPEDGWFLVIGFSTGSYIFGEDYEGQQQLFQDFFKELQGYNPDYSDTTNKNLYWKIENSKLIYNDFSDILKKYHDKNKNELNERKVKKLKMELEQAENNLKK